MAAWRSAIDVRTLRFSRLFIEHGEGRPSPALIQEYEVGVNRRLKCGRLKPLSTYHVRMFLCVSI